MPCLVKTFKKSSAPELMGQSPLNFVCKIKNIGIKKFVQMTILS